MGIVVDHEQRKKVILKKALDVIIEEGYEDATFQKIADRCGITRTTLYIYFKNKREIFLWSIKQLTEGLEKSLQLIMNDKNRSCKDRLLAVLENIVQSCIENRQLFRVILAYLIQIQKTGKNPGDRVRRRIVRLRHLLSTLLIEGKKNGEFKQINVKAANEMFYSLIESAIFRLAILDQQTVDEMLCSLQLAVAGISKD
ncbi:TetR/AcrR family transcriptional regulator [Treponema sp. OMZ 840]|uniref:TetR/AcrR family transcriptional regulator n=1 Tax=Treponema sp. OMZ 840 TaxID=244313 RepID=UPI003D8F3D61